MRRLALMTAGLLAAGGLAVGLSTAGPAQAASGTFTNSAAIAVADNTVFSDVQVSGIGGRITDVDVVLNNLGHTRPNDLDIWLVSPGTNAVAVQLMSDACGSTSISGRTLTFDDEVTAPLTTGCASGTYRPTNIGGGDTTPSGATTLSGTLSGLDGRNPVGNWRLYVIDDTATESGAINGGFTLKITTGPAAISIPTTGLATPYPFQRTVSDQPGRITDVDVVLNGVFHTYPDDLDLLLVSPAGASTLLMSDVCGSADLVNVNLRFDDGAAAAMTDDGPCTSGTFKPSNDDNTDVFNAPAPPGPYGDELSDLAGGVANGTWRLYVVDDSSSDGGFITGVQLVIKTDAAPNTVITKKPPRSTKARKATIAFKSTKGDSTFQCKVDKKGWKSCASPLRLKKLKPGKHTVLVRAIDNSGHRDASPAKVTWKIRR
ncbi:hypothetical protein [Pimelobacter simplex]|uniref:hypothetical protein n=1 Tax=Nocardioides simplex TaxID=2045 RepID=UPI00214FCC41|nr:hypothetical protein [Pimelobacter simplex]UUW89966.1 hypothetical protein M0M43_00350 [Pimelobacter simplex]UUW93795.1 hypothetical protein M0M48_18860 [Pimelobacter simplex]